MFILLCEMQEGKWGTDETESEKSVCVCVWERTFMPTRISLNNNRSTYTDTEHVYQATDGKQPREDQMRNMFVIVNPISRMILSSYGHYLTAVCTVALSVSGEDHQACDSSAVIDKIP